METGYQYTKNIPLALTVSGLFLYEFFNVLPSYLNSPVFPLNSSILLSLSKEIVLTLNSLFNSSLTVLGFTDIAAESALESILSTVNNPNNPLTNDSNILTLITNNNWPETLISSYTQIVSVAYNLYTYGAFWFILLAMILLLAMIAPIYLSRN